MNVLKQYCLSIGFLTCLMLLLFFLNNNMHANHETQSKQNHAQFTHVVSRRFDAVGHPLFKLSAPQVKKSQGQWQLISPTCSLIQPNITWIIHSHQAMFHPSQHSVILTGQPHMTRWINGREDMYIRSKVFEVHLKDKVLTTPFPVTITRAEQRIRADHLTLHWAQPKAKLLLTHAIATIEPHEFLDQKHRESHQPIHSLKTPDTTSIRKQPTAATIPQDHAPIPNALH